MLKNGEGSFKKLIKMKRVEQGYQTRVTDIIENKETEIYSIVDNPRQKNVEFPVKRIETGNNLPLFQSIMEKIAIKVRNP